jgi:hypothetical protein
VGGVNVAPVAVLVVPVLAPPAPADPVPPDPLGAGVGVGVEVVSVISLPWRKPVTRLRALSSDPAHSEKLLTIRFSAVDPPPPRAVAGAEMLVVVVAGCWV